MKNTNKCVRCGHEWTPRNEVIRICPACKSAWWDVEKDKRLGQTGFKNKKLQEMRYAKNVTLEGLAESIGCDTSSVSLWENGERRPSPNYLRKISQFFKVPVSTFFFLCLLIGLAVPAHADQWLITYYSNDIISCGKTDGITASGKLARPNHTAACNWLPFGTKINVGGKEYVVEDHGARSKFGSKKNHIKHVDIFCTSRTEALKLGKKKLTVKIER